MKEKYSYSSGQLFNFAPDSYFERTSRPIYAIIFLLPFIIFYELGTIFINTDALSQSQVRVVAFVWLQEFLEYLGLDSRMALAAPAWAVVIILTGLQLASRKRWRFGIADTGPMLVECILLAVPLIVLSLFLNSSGQPRYNPSQSADSAIRVQAGPVVSCSATMTAGLSQGEGDIGGEAKNKSLLADVVTGIGAGIYEELVFRLILIGVLMIVFQNVLQVSHTASIILSVLVSAAMFSAYHHIIFLNGQFDRSAPFNWTEYGFRTMAGVYFAIVFAIRGFGITAGTHIFYDIIATFINTLFFQR